MIERIRILLRMIMDAESRSIERNYSFFALAEKINEFSRTHIQGIDLSISEIDEQRLRRFLNGEKRKDGGRKYTVPEDPILKAIVEFLTSPNSPNYCFPKEALTASTTALAAAIALREVFENRMTPLVPTSLFIDKSYAASCNRKGARYELIFPAILSDRVLSVHLTVRWVPADVGTKAQGMHRYKGWGVQTPEDNFIVFLRRDINGENLVLLCVDIDPKAFDGTNIDYFSGVLHSLPLEYPHGELYEQDIFEKLKDNTLIFNRDQASN